MSIFPHDLRLSTIERARDFFDHRDRTQHDIEIAEGAALVLYQKLGFALHQSNNYINKNKLSITSNNNGHIHKNVPAATKRFPYRDGSSVIESQGHHVHSGIMRRSNDSNDSDYELAMLTSCLEMVHQAGPDSIVRTWNQIGTEILPLLVKVLSRPFDRLEQHSMDNKLLPRTGTSSSSNMTTMGERAIAMAINRDIKTCVQKVTKILAVYSLVPEAKVPMANCPGLLSILVKIIDTHNINRVKHAPFKKKTDSRMARTVLDKQPMIDNNNNNLANGVRGSLAGPGLHMTEAARFNAIAALTNLAAAEANRMKMLNEPGLVDNIALVVHNERSDVARQCSALAIMNLSHGDQEHVPELSGDNDLLLETLVRFIMVDNDGDDAGTRRNAAVALFNMACADENTVKLVRYRDGLILDALMKLISNERDPYYNDASIGPAEQEARVNAAETIFNMSCSQVSETTERMARHDGLLETLASALNSPKTADIDVQMYCAATLRRIADSTHATTPEQQQPSQRALLSALVRASAWTKSPCIAEAFKVQAEVPANRRLMAEHQGLLTALAKLANVPSRVGGNNKGGRAVNEVIDRVRAAALTAIEQLSREESVRPLLAQNENIVLALVHATHKKTKSARDIGTVNEERHPSTSNKSQSESRLLVKNKEEENEESALKKSLKNILAAM